MARALLTLAARPSASSVGNGVRRNFTRCLSAEALVALSHPINKTQVFISRSQDPFINLSVEHHFLQNTLPWVSLLFIYVNRPCVVYGRNQNPWLEINLARLAQINKNPEEAQWKDLPVELVRRRSGGGTVFHDGGNVNFSVICPRQHFNRNKYAEMVASALQSLGRDTAHVSKRHDIVVRSKPGHSDGLGFKVSGSAYKLTRLKALHHGTCLLNSPNLSSISGLLRSPGESFIKAQGVDSVRSPITNLDLQYDDFVAAVLKEFRAIHGDPDLVEDVTDAALNDANLYEGYVELRSRDWKWGQTPRFTFSTHPFEADSRDRPELPFDTKLMFEAKQGVFEKFEIQSASPSAATAVPSFFVGKKLHDIQDWSTSLMQAGLEEEEARKLGSWLNGVLGTELSAEG